jgi:hypothetical protein
MITEGNAALKSVDFSYLDSDETVRRWKDKIGLLCLNIECDYEGINEMLLGWERHLSRKSGVIVFNCDAPGPSKIIKDKIGNTGKFIIEEKWVRLP